MVLSMAEMLCSESFLSMPPPLRQFPPGVATCHRRGGYAGSGQKLRQTRVESVRFHAKAAVKPRAVVLQCNDRRQLHNLRIDEMNLQPLKQLIGYPLRRDRHGLRQLQGDLFS